MSVEEHRVGRPPVKPEERFWSKVDKGGPTCEDLGPCWQWTASCTPGGYGKFWDGSRHVGAHRFSWELHFDSIPKGLEVCHHCDNPKCVNPSHLFLGTRTDNEIDKTTKGRHPSALQNSWTPSAKLAEDDVRRIRIRLAVGESQSLIARDYGINQSTVSDVATGKAWPHVS